MVASLPTVVGPYVIVRLLGHGRLGDLYLAADAMLDRQVALRMLPELSAESLGEFARQARRRASLQHPAIAPIYMVGEHEGRLYFARPFVAGRTFAEIVSAKAEIPVVRRVEWMATLCDALASAYALGYDRLALRSTEIVVGEDGTPTLLDIGLPWILEGTMAGPLPQPYYSPEELRGSVGDQRSDIFVAGAVLYELITYEKPFGDGSEREILARIAAGEYSRRPDAMAPALDSILAKVLQPDPAARHQTFQQLTADLRRALRLLDGGERPGSLTSVLMPASPRPQIDAARLAQRRAELIEQHLAGSREALQRDAYDEAAALGEQAALLDPDDPRIADLLQLIEVGRLEAQAARLIADARALMEQGALAEAAHRIARALDVVPADPEAQRVSAAIDELRQRRESVSERPVAAPARDVDRPSLPDVADEGRRIDDNVRFTVYRPAVMLPATWHPLLFFTHLSDRRPDAPPGEMHPVARVEAEAARELGPAVASFPRIVQEAAAGIPHEALVRIKPSVPGLVFNPPEYSFLWTESVHRAQFKVRPSSSLDGRTARGTIEVYVGAIPVALVTLAIPVDGRAPAMAATPQDSVRPYRRIFASYSHKDTAIVRQFENYARGIGDSYMRDVIDLRAGELWDDRLTTLIDDADVFQLFWSSHSMRSPFVRREWEHALTVDRPNFLRGLYWESPFPEGEGLPPPQLKARHFASVAVVDEGSAFDGDRTQDTRAGSPAARPGSVLVLEVASSNGEPLPAVTRKVFGAAGGTVGRTKSSDWVLAHSNVSRTHARISCDGGIYYVEDTSTNGLYLNSPLARVERGRRYPIQAGDRLFIDPYELVVSIVTGLDRTAVEGAPTGAAVIAAEDGTPAVSPGATTQPPLLPEGPPISAAPSQGETPPPPAGHERAPDRVESPPEAWAPTDEHRRAVEAGPATLDVPRARSFSSRGMIVTVALAILLLLVVALVLARR
jgi:tetratricopeptide (TPR) repeat protein